MMSDTEFERKLLTMSDEQMLALAKNLPCTKWYWIGDMEDKANDPNIRKVLHGLRTRAYHLEEGANI